MASKDGDIKYVMVKVPLCKRDRERLKKTKRPGRSSGAYVAEAIREKFEREDLEK